MASRKEWKCHWATWKICWQLYRKQDLKFKFVMVEVFKTNVRSTRKAKLIIQKLAEEFPNHKINFDLSDCDRILRVQGNDILERKIISIVTSLNYDCEILQWSKTLFGKFQQFNLSEAGWSFNNLTAKNRIRNKKTTK